MSIPRRRINRNMARRFVGKIDKLVTPQSPQSRVYNGPERRTRPTPALSAYSFWRGRRQAVRAEGSREGSFVDIYNPRLAILLLFFFFFTVVDSVSTLVYLEKGGREVNPVAQWMIDQGGDFFILTKGLISAACILFIMVHKNFKYSRIAIIIGFSFYLALTIYHIILQIIAL